MKNKVDKTKTKVHTLLAKTGCEVVEITDHRKYIVHCATHGLEFGAYHAQILTKGGCPCCLATKKDSIKEGLFKKIDNLKHENAKLEKDMESYIERNNQLKDSLDDAASDDVSNQILMNELKNEIVSKDKALERVAQDNSTLVDQLHEASKRLIEVKKELEEVELSAEVVKEPLNFIIYGVFIGIFLSFIAKIFFTM